MNKQLFIVATLSLFLLSCGQRDYSFTPIENGFCYAGHSLGLIDRNTWAGLIYRDTNGKTIEVWSYLGLASPCIQITNKLAVFSGGVYEEGVQRFHDRLIAFDAPLGPRIDITDEIFARYCSDSGVAFTNIVPDSITTLMQTNGAFAVDFIILIHGARSANSIDGGGGLAIIPWKDIKAMMQRVRTSGKLEKEKRSGIEYFRKD